ncbi:hypothetical protein CC80DRAFT_550664 [Byssothecium circinans]|uniref:Uncharacterized protein n=1 Tax=Byssothecium circinans TaxID=147558 RepID=A0A6A5TNB8_9PLEO|nr:hypothetical protein CC80DRAFT_550664 [Byssothecium circinans]
MSQFTAINAPLPHFPNRNELSSEGLAAGLKTELPKLQAGIKVFMVNTLKPGHEKISAKTKQLDKQALSDPVSAARSTYVDAWNDLVPVFEELVKTYNICGVLMHFNNDSVENVDESVKKRADDWLTQREELKNEIARELLDIGKFLLPVDFTEFSKHLQESFFMDVNAKEEVKPSD